MAISDTDIPSGTATTTVVCWGVFLYPQYELFLDRARNPFNPVWFDPRHSANRYQSTISGTPVGIAVMAGGFCVATDTGDAGGLNRMYCSRAGQEYDNNGGYQAAFRVLPRGTGVRGWTAMDDYALTSVQVTDIMQTSQKITSIHGAGCSVCVTIDGLSPLGGDVRCFGCDGRRYQFGSIPMLGQLGRGISTEVVGGTLDNGEDRMPTALSLSPLSFRGGDQCEFSGRPPVISYPRAGTVLTLREGEVDLLSIVKLASKDPASSTMVFILDDYPDSELFSMDPITGALSANLPFDYDELVQDRPDATFTIGVVARDNVGADVEKFSVQVTNVVEPPFYTNPPMEVVQALADETMTFDFDVPGTWQS